jgi:AcrR family transcriptional regulator
VPGTSVESSESPGLQGTARRAAASRRTGRRPGENSSRTAILLAARELFAELGYEGTTIRAIARRAKVDPALVHYFFTSKEGVFEAVLHDAVQVTDVLVSVLDSGMDDLVERLLRTYLMLWEGENGEILAAIFRTKLTTRDSADLVAGSINPDWFVTRLATAIGGEDARLRASLISSQMFGVAVQRYVLKLAPLATISLDSVVRGMKPSIEELAFQR